MTIFEGSKRGQKWPKLRLKRGVKSMLFSSKNGHFWGFFGHFWPFSAKKGPGLEAISSPIEALVERWSGVKKGQKSLKLTIFWSFLLKNGKNHDFGDFFVIFVIFG